MADPLGALSAATQALGQNAATLAADTALAKSQFGALVKWVEAEHPGATVSQLVHDPYVSVVVPSATPVLSSINLEPTLGWYAQKAGIPLGFALSVNYAQSPDNTYPWDQVYQRQLDEVANIGGIATDDTIWQDRFLVPTVTSTTSITTSFTTADAQVAVMKKYGLRPLIYLLAGPSAYSGYTTAISNAGNTAAAALQMMTTVVNAIVTHYKGQADYNIFNELVQFGGYNSNTFTNLMGTSYTSGALATCIQLINAIDPTAKIWLNSNHMETDVVTGGSQTDGVYYAFMLQEATNLKINNPSFTGISFESHLGASLGTSVYTQLPGRITAATSANLKVAIGELDIRDDTGLAAGPAGTAARDAITAAVATTYLTQFFSAAIPDHMICWQLTDGNSWLNSPPAFFPGGSPYDRQANTTDGDKFVVAGQTFYAHTPYPTGAPITGSGTTITIPVLPAVNPSIAGGTTVTFTAGLTGSTFGWTGTLTTSGTQPLNATQLVLTGQTGFPMTGTVMPGTIGRPTVGFDTAGNRKPAYFAVRNALAALIPSAPSAESITSVQTQRYYADGLDQFHNLLATQPTMQWHTSLTGVATVPNNGQTVVATPTGNGLTNITATSGSITSNTQALSVSGFAGFNYPNLPAGFTPIMNTTLSVTGSQPQLAGFAGGFTDNSSSQGGSTANESIVTDATALISPPSVMKVTYPTGFVGGNEPISFYCFGPFQGKGYHQIYFAFAQKMPSSFVSVIDNITKIFYPKSTQGGVCYVNTLATNQGAPYVPQFRTQSPGPTTVNYSPNVAPYNGSASSIGTNTAIIVADQWYIWEVYLKLNTTASSTDGIARVWLTSPALNGGVTTQTHNYTNVQFTSIADTWSELDWQPVYGGGGSNAPAPGVFTYMDNIICYAAV